MAPERNGKEGREDDPSKKDEAHGGGSELVGKLIDDMVREANILTKEATNIFLPAPAEAGNCAMEEATGKLGPSKEKLVVAEGQPKRMKLHPESRSGRIALTMEVVNDFRDKPGPEDEPGKILAEPAEEELDKESSGLTGERSKFEFSG